MEIRTGLKLSELKQGTIYRDRLSGFDVLVVDKILMKIIDSADPYVEKGDVVLRVRYFNSFTNSLSWLEVYDFQLEEKD